VSADGAFHSTDGVVVAEPARQLALQRRGTRETGSGGTVAAQLVADAEIEESDGADVSGDVAERLALDVRHGAVGDRHVHHPTQTGKRMSAQRRQPEVDDAQVPDADEVAERADVHRQRRPRRLRVCVSGFGGSAQLEGADVGEMGEGVGPQSHVVGAEVNEQLVDVRRAAEREPAIK